jgi:hypothetical protein
MDANEHKYYSLRGSGFNVQGYKNIQLQLIAEP